MFYLIILLTNNYITCVLGPLMIHIHWGMKTSLFKIKIMLICMIVISQYILMRWVQFAFNSFPLIQHVFFLLIVLVFRMIITLKYYPSQCQLALLMILHQQMLATHRHNNNMILHQQKLWIHTHNNNKSKHYWFGFFSFLNFCSSWTDRWCLCY